VFQRRNVKAGLGAMLFTLRFEWGEPRRLFPNG